MEGLIINAQSRTGYAEERYVGREAEAVCVLLLDVTPIWEVWFWNVELRMWFTMTAEPKHARDFHPDADLKAHIERWRDWLFEQSWRGDNG